MQTIKDIHRPALRKPAGQGVANLSQKLSQTEVGKRSASATHKKNRRWAGCRNSTEDTILKNQEEKDIAKENYEKEKKSNC